MPVNLAIASGKSEAIQEETMSWSLFLFLDDKKPLMRAGRD